ncbi:hypothetical protein UCRPC4_g06758 [Phaeomoniella chlamydospora]|uniref:Uncharacterized protein n=1 Tax=Phaeomoniella chlamydospora TaxID=158046 RepID=A0A0G2DUS3_PHACM|nr:hypothetical protein UCRPC4_g06758 [Phaeomoniella chlamydospora]
MAFPQQTSVEPSQSAWIQFARWLLLWMLSNEEVQYLISQLLFPLLTWPMTWVMNLAWYSVKRFICKVFEPTHLGKSSLPKSHEYLALEARYKEFEQVAQASYNKLIEQFEVKHKEIQKNTEESNRKAIERLEARHKKIQEATERSCKDIIDQLEVKLKDAQKEAQEKAQETADKVVNKVTADLSLSQKIAEAAATKTFDKIQGKFDNLHKDVKELARNETKALKEQTEELDTMIDQVKTKSARAQHSMVLGRLEYHHYMKDTTARRLESRAQEMTDAMINVRQRFETAYNDLTSFLDEPLYQNVIVGGNRRISESKALLGKLSALIAELLLTRPGDVNFMTSIVDAALARPRSVPSSSAQATSSAPAIPSVTTTRSPCAPDSPALEHGPTSFSNPTPESDTAINTSAAPIQTVSDFVPEPTTDHVSSAQMPIQVTNLAAESVPASNTSASPISVPTVSTQGVPFGASTPPYETESVSVIESTLVTEPGPATESMPVKESVPANTTTPEDESLPAHGSPADIDSVAAVADQIADIATSLPTGPEIDASVVVGPAIPLSAPVTGSFTSPVSTAQVSVPATDSLATVLFGTAVSSSAAPVFALPSFAAPPSLFERDPVSVNEPTPASESVPVAGFSSEPVIESPPVIRSPRLESIPDYDLSELLDQELSQLPDQDAFELPEQDISQFPELELTQIQDQDVSQVPEQDPYHQLPELEFSYPLPEDFALQDFFADDYSDSDSDPGLDHDMNDINDSSSDDDDDNDQGPDNRLSMIAIPQNLHDSECEMAETAPSLSGVADDEDIDLEMRETSFVEEPAMWSQDTDMEPSQQEPDNDIEMSCASSAQQDSLSQGFGNQPLRQSPPATIAEDYSILDNWSDNPALADYLYGEMNSAHEDYQYDEEDMYAAMPCALSEVGTSSPGPEPCASLEQPLEPEQPTTQERTNPARRRPFPDDGTSDAIASKRAIKTHSGIQWGQQDDSEIPYLRLAEMQAPPETRQLWADFEASLPDRLERYRANLRAEAEEAQQREEEERRLVEQCARQQAAEEDRLRRPSEESRVELQEVDPLDTASDSSEESGPYYGSTTRPNFSAAPAISTGSPYYSFLSAVPSVSLPRPSLPSPASHQGPVISPAFNPWSALAAAAARDAPSTVSTSAQTPQAPPATAGPAREVYGMDDEVDWDDD